MLPLQEGSIPGGGTTSHMLQPKTLFSLKKKKKRFVPKPLKGCCRYEREPPPPCPCPTSHTMLCSLSPRSKLPIYTEEKRTVIFFFFWPCLLRTVILRAQGWDFIPGPTTTGKQNQAWDQGSREKKARSSHNSPSTKPPLL